MPVPTVQTKKTAPQSLMPASGTDLHWVIGIALFAFLLYANTLSHGYALDDYHVILSNQHVQMGLRGISSIWTRPTWYSGIQYRPLPATMFALERELGGGSPAPGHWINVFLYAVCCGLLTAWLLKGMGPHRRTMALAASLLFTVHPIHTEVVANIKSRDELLAFFSLLTALGCMWAWIRTTDRRGAAGWMVAATVFFIAGLFAKESVLTFTVVIPLTLYVFTDVPLRRLMTIVGVLFAASGAYLIFSIFIIGSLQGYAADNPLNNALVAIPDHLSRTATALVMMMRYVRLLIFPHPLVHDYGFNRIPAVVAKSPQALLSFAACIGVLVYAVMRIRRRSIAAFAILFFALTISLSSNLVILIGATMGERFLFLPSLGFCILAGYGVQKLLERRWVPVWVIASGLGIVLPACSIKTLSRNGDWKDNLTLFSRDIEHASASATANAALGNMYIITGQSTTDAVQRQRYFQQAVQRLRQAIRIYPDYPYATGNLGLAFEFLDESDSAIVQYRRTLDLNPVDGIAAVNLAGLYVRIEQNDSARAVLERANREIPGSSMIRNLLDALGSGQQVR